MTNEHTKTFTTRELAHKIARAKGIPLDKAQLRADAILESVRRAITAPTRAAKDTDVVVITMSAKSLAKIIANRTGVDLDLAQRAAEALIKRTAAKR